MPAWLLPSWIASPIAATSSSSRATPTASRRACAEMRRPGPRPGSSGGSVGHHTQGKGPRTPKVAPFYIITVALFSVDKHSQAQPFHCQEIGIALRPQKTTP